MDGIENINQFYVNYFVKKSQNTIHKLFPGNFQVLKYTTVTKMKMCASISVFTEKLSLHLERVFSKVKDQSAHWLKEKLTLSGFIFLLIFLFIFKPDFWLRRNESFCVDFNSSQLKKQSLVNCNLAI